MRKYNHFLTPVSQNFNELTPEQQKDIEKISEKMNLMKKTGRLELMYKGECLFKKPIKTK
ncbi:Uncharacterised protein [Phocoenobacter uteri]|uniref:Uncharacterized protein n=1 Tax=Phocoenobacter uteri TaxID=146806 RepID=A0A379DEU7_9PAST|nr:hypothetical protein [Phocoenobacter uteri]MDG6882816.1 hypothetical protein [Phocoenobacter uteri]SUB76399.1 Uncharacterised protein [Phocoenobacter uteri]